MANKKKNVEKLSVEAPGFVLYLDTGNAAFHDFNDEDCLDSSAEAAEVQRILREIADRLEYGHRSGVCSDYNGNRVGEWKFVKCPDTDKTIKFAVLCNRTEMLPDGDGGWEENARHFVGEISVKAKSIDAVTDKLLLEALFNLKLQNIDGLSYPAISTTDRRIMYAEDYYGDGSWWEVGIKKGHEPCYGLKRQED